VRWGCFDLAVNGFEHGREIFDHIVVPKTDHTISMGGEFGSAFVVLRYLIRMLAAVEFDYQLLCRAGEIGDPIADRMLATEFQKRKAFA